MPLVLGDLPRLPPGYVRRERLDNSLSLMKDLPLVVIEGPPGIGKTSLMAGWATQQLPLVDCLWITLDSSVSSSDILWRSIVEAISPEMGEDPVGYAGLAAWISKREKPLRLVIDDFYWAPVSVALEVPKLAELLTNGQLVLLTRRDAEGTLKTQTQRIASGWISAEDLYLNLDEVRLLKSEMYPQSTEFTAAEFEQLQPLSEGHVLLTRLALKSDGLATAQEIAEKSGGWILGQLESRNYTNTLRVSLLPFFNRELLEVLFGPVEARSLIADLERTGVGHAAPNGFMMLCGPAGAAVKHQALLVLSPEEQHKTCHVAAGYFKCIKGYAVETVQLLCVSGRYEELWPYFASNFEDVLHPEVVEEIDALPQLVLEQYPMVATLSTIVQAARERIPSLGIVREVDSALVMLRADSQDADVEEQLYKQIACLALIWSARRFEEAEGTAEVIADLLGQLDACSDAVVRNAAYWGLLYATVMMTLCGHFDVAERYLYAMENDRDPLRTERRTLQRAYINAMRGEILSSRQFLATNVFHVEDSAHWSLVYAITQAAILLEGGDALAARNMLKEVESLFDYGIDWPYALIVLARSHLFTSPEAGDEDLRRLMREHGDRAITSSLRDILQSAMADLALAAGDLNRAKELLSLRTEVDISMSLSAARIGLIAGDRKALRQLERLAENDALGSRVRTQTLHLLAVYRHRRGDEIGARDAWTRSMTLAQSCGITVVHALVPQNDIAQIAKSAGVTPPPSSYRIPRLEVTLETISLPKREYLLLHYLATSAKFRTIAAREFVSLNTIKSQAISIYQKLGVNSRKDAVDNAKQRGLLDMTLVEQLELGCQKDLTS